MNTMKSFRLLIVFLLFTAFAFAQDNRPVTEQYKEKLAAMLVSNDEAKVIAAQQDFQNLCFQLGTPGNEAKKKELVVLMLKSLDDPDAAAAHFWLIRQVGRLGDGSAATTLGKFLDSEDAILRTEALWALANVPDKAAEKNLADKLTKEKDAEKIAALKQAIQYHVVPEQVKIKPLDEILTVLSGADEKAWDTALPSLAWLKDAKIAAVPKYKERFATLSPRAKVLLLDALSVVRDHSALPLAVELTKSDDESLKLAGYRALGLLGDKSALPLLVGKIREKDAFGNTVRDSLCRLNFVGADKAIIDLYEKSSDNGVKGELLDVLRRRKGTVALPIFAQALNSDDTGLRSKALGALENIGDASVVPALVDRFLRAENTDVRGAAERTIITICSRYDDEDGRGQHLCDEIAKRKLDEQRLLLSLLGRIGGTASKKLVKELLKNPALADAAFKALCVWPDASVADELYQIASPPDDLRRNEATKAYLRVVTLRSDRSPKDSLKLFEKGMQLAKSLDDKKFLLVRVETARSMEVFNFVVPYLDDADLVQEACRSVVDMANDNTFYMGNRRKIDPILDKVIERSKDKNHIERAKRYKDRR